jgi:hypothetical protein
MLSDKVLNLKALVYTSIGFLVCSGVFEIQKYYSIVGSRLEFETNWGKYYDLYTDKVSLLGETYIMIIGFWNIIVFVSINNLA